MDKLNNIIGMSDKKQLARIQIISCTKQGKTFPHTLLYGIGGLGKTKLARAIANELGYRMYERQGSTLKNRDDIYNLLTDSIEGPSLIFIDECHRLDSTIQEELYVPMEEFKISTGDGLINIYPFTLFAATTQMNLLDSGSFVTRFHNVWELQRYTFEELDEIVLGYIKSEGLGCEREALQEIVQRSMGVPRTAINLARKALDVCIAYNNKIIMSKHALYAFGLEKIDRLGLTNVHHRYLHTLSRARKAMGVLNLSSTMRLTKAVVEGSIEPILFELGFVKIEKGRVITEKGRKYIENL